MIRRLALLSGLPLFASCGGSHPVSVMVIPATRQVLTCTIDSFQATVTNATDTAVAWSVKPATGAGAIDDTGSYASPATPPNPPMVSIVATSHTDAKYSGASAVTLATAFPAAPTAAADSTGVMGSPGAGVYLHTVAAQGRRVYAAWPDNPAGSSAVGLKVARSDDSGASWQPSVTAISATLQGATTADGGLECPAIAIDAGNPDVVYATARVNTENSASMAQGANTSGPQTLLFAVSADAGQTWTTSVLHVGSGGGVCADVASPVADAVTVVAPGWSDCGRDMFVWSDNARGAGFASGSATTAPVEYFADGYTGALDDLAGDPQCTAAHLHVESDGGTAAAGDATESPRLFTDPVGNLCVVYVGDMNGGGGTVVHSYVQCSRDLGQSFSAPLVLDPSAAKAPSSASGAAKPTGGSGAIWTTGAPGELFLATSADGATFGAPVRVPVYTFPGQSAPAIALNPTLAYDFAGILWVAYHATDDGSAGAIIVDKSCDDGATWSGAVAVSTAPAQKWPVLSLIPSFAPRLTAWDGDHLATFTLAP
jgi:hypothetical protein